MYLQDLENECLATDYYDEVIFKNQGLFNFWRAVRIAQG